MEMVLEQQKPPDVSAQQRESNELIKLIRKLRWMGLEAEAEQVVAALRSVPPADTVLATPSDTD